MAGAIVRQFASEVDGRECHFLNGFSKISLAIPDGFAWWRENQILQVKAHLLVSTRGPGKIVFASNFASEGWSMPSKISRSLRTTTMTKNTMDLHCK